MTQEQTPRRISDVVPDRERTDYPSTTLADVAGIDVFIHAARKATVPSKYARDGQHEAYFVDIEDIAGGKYTLLVSQQVLMDKLDRLNQAGEFPVTACFKRDGKYWDVT